MSIRGQNLFKMTQLTFSRLLCLVLFLSGAGCSWGPYSPQGRSVAAVVIVQIQWLCQGGGRSHGHPELLDPLDKIPGTVPGCCCRRCCCFSHGKTYDSNVPVLHLRQRQQWSLKAVENRRGLNCRITDDRAAVSSFVRFFQKKESSVNADTTNETRHHADEVHWYQYSSVFSTQNFSLTESSRLKPCIRSIQYINKRH